jgi:hypothetical protein
MSSIPEPRTFLAHQAASIHFLHAQQAWFFVHPVWDPLALLNNLIFA